MDYDAMRSELAALDSMVPYASPQNPFSPMNRGMQNEATPHNAKVWEEDQARQRASVEARKQYLRKMLASQQAEPYGDQIRQMLK